VTNCQYTHACVQRLGKTGCAGACRPVGSVSVSVSMIIFFLVVVAYGADVSARNMRWMHVHGNVLVQLFFLRRF